MAWPKNRREKYKETKFFAAITGFFVAVLLISNVASTKILDLGIFVFDGGTPGEPIYGTRVDADIRDTDFEENRFLRSLVIGRRYQVGYREKRGKGEMAVIGVRPSPELVTALHRYLDVAVPIIASPASVKPALFQRDGKYFVVVLNMADQPAIASLDIPPSTLGGNHYSCKSLRKCVEVDDRELGQGRLYARLPAKDGGVIELSEG